MTDQLDWYLSFLSKRTIQGSKIIYWSYFHEEESNYSLLKKASAVFGEKPNRGSEPDIIIISNTHLFFIEAKFTATNNTKPSNLSQSKNYIDGSNNWFNEIFNANYHQVAIESQKY